MDNKYGHIIITSEEARAKGRIANSVLNFDCTRDAIRIFVDGKGI